MTYYDELRQFKREYWQRMLQKYPKRGELARAAGVNRTHLYQLLRGLVKIKDLRHYGKWDV